MSGYLRRRVFHNCTLPELAGPTRRAEHEFRCTCGSLWTWIPENLWTEEVGRGRKRRLIETGMSGYWFATDRKSTWEEVVGGRPVS